ncbi:MAG TPA: carotenoid biosynthesis protein [Bacteroidales bacterium]|nr:carotenoid biosynthesis protein [Bacteroidales bacterium]
MEQLTKYFRVLIPIAYLIGVAGISVKIDSPQYFRVTTFFVPLSFLMLILFHKPNSRRFWLIMGLIGIMGFSIEAIGTNTGVIFGRYTYGASLGPSLFGTPFNMAINWMMLVYLVAFVLQRWNTSLALKSVASAIILTVFDWILEPVAIRLDMWSWDWVTPPLHNYIGWFLFSLLVFGIFYRFSPKLYNPLANLFALMHGLFFIALNLIFRLI